MDRKLVVLNRVTNKNRNPTSSILCYVSYLFVPCLRVVFIPSVRLLLLDFVIGSDDVVTINSNTSTTVIYPPSFLLVSRDTLIQRGLHVTLLHWISFFHNAPWEGGIVGTLSSLCSSIRNSNFSHDFCDAS